MTNETSVTIEHFTRRIRRYLILHYLLRYQTKLSFHLYMLMVKDHVLAVNHPLTDAILLIMNQFKITDNHEDLIKNIKISNDVNFADLAYAEGSQYIKHLIDNIQMLLEPK